MNSQKGNIILTITIFIAIIFSSITSYLLWQNQQLQQNTIPQSQTPTPKITATPQPTSSSTANWKTFTDNKYNFSFRYPDYFQYIHPNQDFGGAYLAPKEGGEGETRGSPMALGQQDVWLSVTTSSGANISTLEDFFNTKGQGAFFQYEYTNSKKQKVAIGGLEGYKIIIDQPFLNELQPTVLYEGIVMNNNLIYHIDLYAFNKKSLTKFETIFDQIISTFKFIDQNQSDETSNWNTYSISGVDPKPLKNITFQLPPNLKPLWVNAGHYYQTITLPNNSTMAIIPVGKGQGIQWTWEGLQEMISLNGFASKNIALDKYSGLEFTGSVVSSQSTSLNILGEADGPIKATVIKISDTLYLEILHYQEKSTIKNKPVNFSADSQLFDQILSTFKFTQ